MNVIVQEEPYGCGIASVANIVGITYSEAKSKANSMGIHAGDEMLFSDTGHVRKLLRSFGVDTTPAEQPFTSWDNLPDECLLATKYHEENGTGYWHWVAFKRIKSIPVVMDSSASINIHERYDFDEIKPKWSIEVLRKP